MLSKSFKNENFISFSNSIWRQLLTNVCKTIDKKFLGLQIISPFGFELLENKNSYKSIKRMYCYIGIPEINASRCSPLEISLEFTRELMSSISQIGILQSDIAILVIQNQFNLLHNNHYTCSASDKLIDIQSKIITDNTLHDYARYIICTIDSIFSKKDEPKHFLENKRHRCRTYQLYVMLENIFGYLLPPMSSFQKEIFFSILKRIDNSIQMFYTPAELYISASSHEINLLNFLITPRVDLMHKAIQHSNCPNEVITIQCDAYHTEERLQLKINKKIYDRALEKIKTTYLNYT